jgi:hypothetical protein
MLHNLSDSPTEKQIDKYLKGLEYLFESVEASERKEQFRLEMVKKNALTKLSTEERRVLGLL